MIGEEKIFNTAVEATIAVIGGKWKPVILFHLTFGEKRNNELRNLTLQGKKSPASKLSYSRK